MRAYHVRIKEKEAYIKFLESNTELKKDKNSKMNVEKVKLRLELRNLQVERKQIELEEAQAKLKFAKIDNEFKELSSKFGVKIKRIQYVFLTGLGFLQVKHKPSHLEYSIKK